MADHFNQTFKDQAIMLDGNRYEGCTFENCKLVFSGTADPGLSNSTFSGCSWNFDGAAARTIQFMTALYASGGDAKALIEGTFNNIRKGASGSGPNAITH